MTKDTIKVLWCDTCERVITSRSLHKNHRVRMKDTKIKEADAREYLVNQERSKNESVWFAVGNTQ